MDMQLIGAFLAQLRKEHRMTQEQLGERIGVSNKTVSRWETGTYLPPVEMLKQLSELYGITINEILSGCRLDAAEYTQKAEENIAAAMEASAFTLKEKIDFFKKKWIREHAGMILLEIVVLIALFLVGIWKDSLWWVNVCYIMMLIRLFGHRNDMMTYVEARAFDGSGRR